MISLAIEMPDEVFSAFKTPPREFTRLLRLAAAIHWYTRNEISMEKAALVAGIDRVDFLELLALQHIDVFNIDVESLKWELEHA